MTFPAQRTQNNAQALDVLARADVQVQHFLSRACFTPLEAATSITGLTSRHLDSWLMQPHVCRELFARGASAAKLALVEGCYTSARCPHQSTGGSLDELCSWLDLPRIAIVDAARMRDCCPPPRPEHVDGIILDRVGDDRDYFRQQTHLEALWGVPVLGGLPRLDSLRAEVAALPGGTALPRRLCSALGEALARTANVGRLLALAAERDFHAGRPSLFAREEGETRLRVAVAYDDAFGCYFPDSLELLEQRGATVIDFSPLRDEALPPGVDVVYFGCGHPERYAEELAGNLCMAAALRNHLCTGRRIYAEGGGAAYLCQSLETPDGMAPMAGVLPAVARLNPQPAPPRAVEATLGKRCWLGPAGARVRGYLNSHWHLEPSGPLTNHLPGRPHGGDLVGRHHAIGSRLHLDFAAQPHLLNGFLHPHAACLEVAQSRSRQG